MYNLDSNRRPQRRQGLSPRLAVEVLSNAQKVRADSDLKVVNEVTAIISSGDLGTSITTINNRLDDIEAALP